MRRWKNTWHSSIFSKCLTKTQEKWGSRGLGSLRARRAKFAETIIICYIICNLCLKNCYVFFFMPSFNALTPMDYLQGTTLPRVCKQVISLLNKAQPFWISSQQTNRICADHTAQTDLNTDTLLTLHRLIITQPSYAQWYMCNGFMTHIYNLLVRSSGREECALFLFTL